MQDNVTKISVLQKDFKSLAPEGLIEDRLKALSYSRLPPSPT